MLSPRRSIILILLIRSILVVSALKFELPSHIHNKGLPRPHTFLRKHKRDPILPEGWSYLGCYSDGSSRTLTASTMLSSSMTIESCIDYCQQGGYAYAGTEYGSECHCDNAIQNGGTATTGCSMMCSGDATEVCGGSWLLSIYYSNNPPGNLESYAGWTYQGCYTDSAAVRTLTAAVAYTGTLTPQKCLDTCRAGGYKYAGLEYSVECYCGNAIQSSATVAQSGCSMTCSGAPNLLCGGANRLSVYEYGPSSTSSESSDTTSPTPSSTMTSTVSSIIASASPTVLQTYGNWESQGCWSDSTAARSLPFGIGLNGVTTPQRCMDACYDAGYGFAGLEYAAECYCGSAIMNGGTLQSDDGCNMACNGNPNLLCGGPDRLNLYKYNGTVPPPTTGGGGTGVPPLTTGLPTPWQYNGCWVDNAHGRIMAHAMAPNTNNSALTCIATCSAAGFNLAGTEYSNECYCDNGLVNAATPATADGECNMACAGDTDHACGGPNRVSLYAATSTFPVYPVPTAKTTDLPGSYQYTGCFAEPPGAARVWPYQIIDEINMSVDKCLSQCGLFGYAAASLQYQSECWCGDPEMLEANGGTVAPDEDCSLPCTGSPTELCGGVRRFNLYTWPTSPNPLYLWHTPTNTGHYEFLIGGVVIPLIATLGINNKVNFLEKFGTGPPNSTGAYELDYSLADNFEAAWRELHVTSDVFCAANIVLPDRAGRVLSVGGWSFESTEGVRLYTPSGSPGVPGNTDWEEVYQDLHLQQGRWYPGAMVMANGSILVVGGEEGSNGFPVPSLEVLPKPEGGPTYIDMDWLLRTDPNNLYPFLFVLPGGGIFVLYYNEARILDEVTFATVKEFPIIPGSVNAAGGRTYPMEGTSVMLPQHAPYTEPVEILTCGGSAFGQAFDNCVSIVPEGAGEWVIERMPSRRVMTIMAPLPDGTFMIMGGAKAGVAGFGLANTPNLDALLYDPSQPRHQRFSILNSTIVPRLYHSEATLLHDGRVMVTGSDPQDDINPQEYRVEVYVPPYLTDGRIQPSYTIEERDWAYGSTHDIVVTLPQGPISAMRVSLVGAISSTHGSSFGQRVLFPAFTCQGTTCSITAPPNAHLCPPGWFMLFILDGPTPSHSQWVRIGGDPSQLGNWPDYPGFTLPGMGHI